MHIHTLYIYLLIKEYPSLPIAPNSIKDQNKANNLAAFSRPRHGYANSAISTSGKIDRFRLASPLSLNLKVPIVSLIDHHQTKI